MDMMLRILAEPSRRLRPYPILGPVRALARLRPAPTTSTGSNCTPGAMEAATADSPLIDLAAPARLETGQIPTANAFGVDMGVPCYRIEAWLDSYNGKNPLYDIGCGYGSNTRCALERRPDAKLVAIDCCEQHLAYVRACSPEAIAGGRLVTKFGSLPEVAIEEGGASGILIAQVIHFLPPKSVTRTFENALRWLAPGGTLVILAMSHYFKPFIATGHVARITAQMEEEGDGNPDSWPGWLEDLPSVSQDWGLPAAAPHLHTFTDRQIQAVAERAGFEIVECKMVEGSVSNYPALLCVDDVSSPVYGKEQVVLVARKPK